MVRRDHDHRVVCDPRRFQLPDQIRHSRFQIQIRGNVALDGFGIRKIRHLIVVLPGHGIGAIVIGGVAANGHVIQAEGLVIQMVRDGELEHLLVTLGPLLGDAFFQTVAVAQVNVIAQQLMGLMTGIVGVVVIVVCRGAVAQLLQLIANGQEQVLLVGFLHTATAVGEHSDHVGEFTARGSGTPGGLVIFRELDALGSHAIEGGG